jgi:succinate dehydrogenase / fumarate reductase flavoprotein subunit
VQQEEAKYKKLLDSPRASAGDDKTNPYLIHKELGDEMTAACTVVKSEPRLKQCLARLAELQGPLRERERAGLGRVDEPDGLVHAGRGRHAGHRRGDRQGVHRAPRERGAPTTAPTIKDRDDDNFMKTTLAKYDATSQTTSVEFVPIDASLIQPRARTYGKKESDASGKAAKPALAAT